MIIKKAYHNLQLLTAILLSVTIFSCTQQTTAINEGIVEGYLSQEEIPNSLNILPPPPEEGSAAFILDQEIAAKYVALEDELRKEQAVKDATLAFPEATEAFNIVLAIQISEESTPNLYLILRKTLIDAALSTYAAKYYYQRQRPFVVNNTPTCTPDYEEALSTDGSYPSGHTAIGWAWALILTEVFPEQADVILERGEEFGISRNVCNVHWHSDVVYGRTMGEATVAALQANTDFGIDLEAAKKEVELLRTN